MATALRSRRTRSLSLVLIIIVGVFIVLGLSIFRSYLGIRVSGIPLDQSVIGGALKSDSLTIGTHTLEFKGKTRDNKQLAHQVSFAVQAPGGGGGGGTEIEVARLKFRVDPRLIEGTSQQEVAQRLVRYVDDINSVFAKNTVRRFVYDPSSDFEVWTRPDLGHGCVTASPNYSFVVYLTKLTEGTQSLGGSFDCARVNEPSLIGVKSIIWPKVYSEQDLATNSAYHDDYLGYQVFTLIHELGHAHSLGIGEYYNLSQLRDNSGVEPDLDVGLKPVAESPYWSDHQLVPSDPMSGRGLDFSLALRKFSPLSAEIINRVARGQEPPACAGSLCMVRNDPENPVVVTVETVHALTGAPLAGCQVKMYGLVVPTSNVQENLNSESFPMASGVTGPDGTYAPHWGGSLMHNKYNMARLFKVQCPGFQPSGKWLSTFDLQAAITLPGGEPLMPNGGVEGDFRYPGKLTIKMQPR